MYKCFCTKIWSDTFGFSIAQTGKTYGDIGEWVTKMYLIFILPSLKFEKHTIFSKIPKVHCVWVNPSIIINNAVMNKLALTIVYAKLELYLCIT